MPAIPAIISGGAAIGSSLIGGIMGKKAASSAMQKTPEEQNAFAANTRLAGQQTKQGNEMFNTAMPAVKSSLGYYNTLLSGNRAARVGAVAPEAESISSAYDGANRATARGYVQGGVRDQAIAENARAKAGQISRLTTGVRPGAAAAMSQIGASLLPGAAARAGTAANIYGGQGYTEMQNRKTGREAGGEASANFGGLFARLLSLTGKGGGGSGSGGGGNGLSYEPSDENGWG